MQMRPGAAGGAITDDTLPTWKIYRTTKGNGELAMENEM